MPKCSLFSSRREHRKWKTKEPNAGLRTFPPPMNGDLSGCFSWCARVLCFSFTHLIRTSPTAGTKTNGTIFYRWHGRAKNSSGWRRRNIKMCAHIRASLWQSALAVARDMLRVEIVINAQSGSFRNQPLKSNLLIKLIQWIFLFETAHWPRRL